MYVELNPPCERDESLTILNNTSVTMHYDHGLHLCTQSVHICVTKCVCFSSCALSVSLPLRGLQAHNVRHVTG